MYLVAIVMRAVMVEPAIAEPSAARYDLPIK